MTLEGQVVVLSLSNLWRTGDKDDHEQGVSFTQG
jgi:hypothetical protein